MLEPADRRKAERFPVNAQTSCSFLARVAEDFGPATIKNLSTDGIGLLVTRRPEPGALLAVTLSNPARKFVKTVLVQVTHVTAQHGGSHLVGGNLSAPLTYEELTALVL